MKKYKNDLIRQVHDYFVLAVHEAAKLDGNLATFDQTEEIINTGYTKNLDSDDIKVIINLKHAYENAISMANDPNWKYDYKDVVYMNRLIGIDLIQGAGAFRYKDVMVGGVYHPPFPPTHEIWKDELQKYITRDYNLDDVVRLYGYITKQQIFNNGNKRTALVFCNSLLISKAIGFINIPVNKKTIFSQKILEFYANKIDETQFINEVKQNWFINKFEYYDKKYQQSVESNDKYKVTSESFDEYKKEKGSLPHNYDETKGTTPKQK